MLNWHATGLPPTSHVTCQLPYALSESRTHSCQEVHTCYDAQNVKTGRLFSMLTEICLQDKYIQGHINDSCIIFFSVLLSALE